MLWHSDDEEFPRSLMEKCLFWPAALLRTDGNAIAELKKPQSELSREKAAFVIWTAAGTLGFRRRHLLVANLINRRRCLTLFAPLVMMQFSASLSLRMRRVWQSGYRRRCLMRAVRQLTFQE